MAFDGIVTKAIITELEKLVGSKIDKIYEPNKNIITFGLYFNGKNYILNICIDSHNCRINLTQHTKTNPITAPDFCMLLRKHLLGGRIIDISMNGIERLVKIQIETINEFNEIEVKTLVIEIMGKHSNIILVNSKGVIIDSMRHINSINSYREILPSRIYVLPKSDKIQFADIEDYDDFKCKLFNNSALSLENELEISEIEAEAIAEQIVKIFTGFSLSFAKSVVSLKNLKKMYNYICKILEQGDNLKFDVIYKDDKMSDYVLTICENNKQDFELNYFIDDFYYQKETEEEFVNYRNILLRMILNTLKKYNKRLENIRVKLNECEQMDQYRLYGELITSNLYRLSNIHASSVEVENYYDNNNIISIPLDIKYTASVNAKRYFKKYSKLKNAFEIVSKQKYETEKELEYIESVVFELENTSNIEDVEDVFLEISENDIFKTKLKKDEKKKQSNKKKKIHHAFKPIEYEIDGFKVFVGRNNKENDWLTFSFANKSDIWFHVKDVQGSHVILQVANDDFVSDEIFIKCAIIAAKHSRAKDSSNVPVDYCKIQYVKKPRGAKPGMVIFSNNKTLNVSP